MGPEIKIPRDPGTPRPCPMQMPNCQDNLGSAPCWRTDPRPSYRTRCRDRLNGRHCDVINSSLLTSSSTVADAHASQGTWALNLTIGKGCHRSLLPSEPEWRPVHGTSQFPVAFHRELRPFSPKLRGAQSYFEPNYAPHTSKNEKQYLLLDAI